MKSLAAGTVLLLFGFNPAIAQQPCASRSDILTGLAAEFNEVPTAAGLTKNGVVFELILSPDGSWSIIYTLPQGRTCLIAGGTAWDAVKPKGTGT